MLLWLPSVAKFSFNSSFSVALSAIIWQWWSINIPLEQIDTSFSALCRLPPSHYHHFQPCTTVTNGSHYQSSTRSDSHSYLMCPLLSRFSLPPLFLLVAAKEADLGVCKRMRRKWAWHTHLNSAFISFIFSENWCETFFQCSCNDKRSLLIACLPVGSRCTFLATVSSRGGNGS